MNFYRIYLALDGVQKRLEGTGFSIGRTVVKEPGSMQIFRDNIERDVEQGNVPDAYRFGELDIYLNEPPADWSATSEAREADMQMKREVFIRAFAAKYSNAIIARYPNSGMTYISWMAYDDIGVTLNVGKALCEKVLVREETEEVPDPELLEKALADIPKVKKIKPIYEYRCNDAELVV